MAWADSGQVVRSTFQPLACRFIGPPMLGRASSRVVSIPVRDVTGVSVSFANEQQGIAPRLATGRAFPHRRTGGLTWQPVKAPTV